VSQGRNRTLRYEMGHGPTEQRATGRRRWRVVWVTRVAAAATITVTLVGTTTRPVHAGPIPDAPPPPAAAAAEAAPGDLAPAAGALPAADGGLVFPSLPQPALPPPADVVGPLAREIMAESAETERLGEQVKLIQDEMIAAQDITSQIRDALDQATEDLEQARSQATAIATDVYKDATALGPFDEYTKQLQDFSLVAPALPGQVDPASRPSGRDSIWYEIMRCEEAVNAIQTAHEAALAAEEEIAGRLAVAQEQFQRHRAALTTLKARNSALIGPAIEARDRYEDSLAASRGLGGNTVNGMRAGPAALAAVGFALRQLGKPYEWAAEGPWTFDCSGLVLASYQSVGITLPRVSRQQFHAGSPVLVSQLLPGDLLFFSTDRSDWRKIHHVAIYIGGGRMVHAPTFGDVVRIAPIWWSEFFAATRIVPAVPAPGGGQPTTQPPTTTPPPTTTRPPATTTRPPATTTTPPATTTTPPVTTTEPPTTTPPPPTTTAPPTTPAAPTTTTEPPAETTPAPTPTPEPEATPTPAAPSPSALPPAVTSPSSGEVRRHRRPRRFFRSRS
jgi:peptidoglycan DL-endopeptidase CwlO